MKCLLVFFFFFSSRRRHTRWPRDWSSDVCSSDLLRSQDVRRLIAIPGVGKKTAERMVLELSEKASKLPGEAPAKAPAAVAADDVISALVNLGYRKSEAERAVDAAARAGAPKEFAEFLKEALRR